MVFTFAKRAIVGENDLDLFYAYTIACFLLANIYQDWSLRRKQSQLYSSKNAAIIAIFHALFSVAIVVQL